MKSMKLLGGLLLAGALVGMACRAGEESKGKTEKIGVDKVYDFSIRNVTPQHPIWVAYKTYKKGKVIEKSKLEKMYDSVGDIFGKKKGCSLEKQVIHFTKLDAKNPVLKKKFVGQIRVIVSSKQKDPKAEYQKCEFMKNAEEQGADFLTKNAKIVLNPGNPFSSKGDVISFDKNLAMNTFHVDVAVKKDGILDIRPASSTPRVKVPSNNISKEKLNKHTANTKIKVKEDTFEEEEETDEEETDEEETDEGSGEE